MIFRGPQQFYQVDGYSFKWAMRVCLVLFPEQYLCNTNVVIIGHTSNYSTPVSFLFKDSPAPWVILYFFLDPLPEATFRPPASE